MAGAIGGYVFTRRRPYSVNIGEILVHGTKGGPWNGPITALYKL